MIDAYNWKGYATNENIEELREALRKRMRTYHIVLTQVNLFSARDLTPGDHILFAQDKIEIIAIYKHAHNKRETIVISGEDLK